jgi:transposase-like protein
LEKYDGCVTQVVRELGYPTRTSLYAWYKEYQEAGVVRVPETKAAKYSPEQKQVAVAHWLEHGRRFARTIKALGYPGRTQLRQWIEIAARYGFLMAEVVEGCGSRYDIRSFGVQHRSPIAGLLSMKADT